MYSSFSKCLPLFLSATTAIDSTMERMQLKELGVATYLQNMWHIISLPAGAVTRIRSTFPPTTGVYS